MADLEFECCFCEKDIESTNVDPSILTIMTHTTEDEEDANSQDFFCHFSCFQKKISPNISLFLTAHEKQ